MNASSENLVSRWMALCGRLGLAGDAQECFQKLTGRYEGPGRNYHNLAHIVACLGELDKCAAECDEPDMVEMALWYHDAVYDPRAADNEECSARLARSDLTSLGGGETLIRTVEELILCTKHSGGLLRDDARWMVDIDLAVLGQPAQVFDAYERGIRLEYGHVEEMAFRQGRARVLRAFLDRPHIYATQFFRDKYEVLARENLQRSLGALSG